jgi:hypothetical protein
VGDHLAGEKNGKGVGRKFNIVARAVRSRNQKTKPA